jgi:hypothetical protein
MATAEQVKEQINQANQFYDENGNLIDPDTVIAGAENEIEVDEVPAVIDDDPYDIPVLGQKEETVPKKEFDAVVQQLRTLQGIHKKLQSERNNAVTAANDLYDQLEVYKKAETAAKNNPKTISAEEEEQYTPELMDIIGRKAEEIVAPQLAALKDTVANLTERNRNLEATLSNVSHETDSMAKERFQSDIATIMPDFNRVNNDPNFMVWLDTTNELTGRPFAEDFYHAARALDAERVVVFFREYDKLNGYDANSNGVASLEEQETPSTRRGARPPAKQGELWTQAKIAQFYKDKSSGKYKDNPDLALRLEKDIFKAQNEGRISA